MTGAKRSNLEIAHALLVELQAGHGKTRILMRANLCSETLTRYLHVLEREAFVAHDAQTGKYTVTSAGLAFFADLERIVPHLRAIDGPVNSTAEPD